MSQEPSVPSYVVRRYRSEGDESDLLVRRRVLREQWAALLARHLAALRALLGLPRPEAAPLTRRRLAVPFLVGLPLALALGGCGADSREPERAAEPAAPSGDDLALRTAKARLREAAPEAFADWEAVAAELRHAEAAAEAARAEVAARKAEVAEATAAAEAALREAEERGPAAVAALEAALAKTRSAKAVAIAAASPVAHQVRMTLAEQEARKRLAEAAPEEWARFAAEAGLPERAEPTVLDELDRLGRELEP